MKAPLSSWVITVKVFELQKSLLDTWKFFTPFLNTLTADDKYSLLVETSEWKQFKSVYLENKTFFLNFFVRFSNIH